MKQKQRFLFSLLMAIVMMAMSPTKVWAEGQVIEVKKNQTLTFNEDRSLGSLTVFGTLTITAGTVKVGKIILWPDGQIIIKGGTLEFDGTQYAANYGGTLTIEKEGKLVVPSSQNCYKIYNGMTFNYGTITGNVLIKEETSRLRFANHGTVNGSVNASSGNKFVNTGTITGGGYTDENLYVCSHNDYEVLSAIGGNSCSGRYNQKCLTCGLYYEGNNDGSIIHENATSTNGIGHCANCNIDFYEPATAEKQNDGTICYSIGNAGQLYWFASKVNDGTKRDANAKLTDDIIVNPGKFSTNGTYTPVNGESPRLWTPIGEKDGVSYTGTFDGNGHTISGLYYKNPKNEIDSYNIALFGVVQSGRISKVGVINSYFSGYRYIAGICGRGERVTITNCYSEASVNGIRYPFVNDKSTQSLNVLSFANYNGGICGHLASGTISNCMNSGYIYGGEAGVGGIVGSNQIGTVVDNVNTGTVISNRCHVGSIIGFNQSYAKNNYYLSGTAKDHYNVVQNGTGNGREGYSTPDALKTTTEYEHYGINSERLASGEIAGILNGYESAGAWHQKIGTDKYPVFKATDDNVIYVGYASCDATVKTFTNDKTVNLQSTQGHKTKNVFIKATCTEAGSKAKVCIYCKQTISSTPFGFALGHVCVTDAAVASTCTATGLTEGEHCSVCNYVITAQEVVPMLEHKFTNYSNIISPSTCEGSGSASATCDYGCGAVSYQGTAATGHNWKVTGIESEATCVNNRKEIYTCQNANCGKTKIDFANATAFGHSLETIAAKEATCTETGTKLHYHCTRCDRFYSIDNVWAREAESESSFIIPALEHDWIDINAEGGLHYGNYDMKQQKLIEHDAVLSSPATCTEAAKYHSYCKRCFEDDYESEQEVGLPLGHRYVIDKVNAIDLTKNENTVGNFTLSCHNYGCLESAVIDIHHPTIDPQSWQTVELTSIETQPTCKTGKGEYQIGYKALQPNTQDDNYWTYATVKTTIPALNPTGAVNGAHDYDENGKCTVKEHSKAQAKIMKQSFDDNGQLSSVAYYETLTGAGGALQELGDNCSIKLFTDLAMSENLDMASYAAYDLNIDLNGHTLDGEYTAYEEVWDGNDWVEDKTKPKQAYRRLTAEKNLTIMNGTLKAEVDNQDYDNDYICNIANATVTGSRFSWRSKGGVNLYSATLDLNAAEGYGSFGFNACDLDNESTIKLKGVNSLGSGALVPGGYKDVMHRLAVPAGYVLKQPFSDKNLAFFAENNMDWAASMKGKEITIKGSDPLGKCSEYKYLAVNKNDETSYWTDYDYCCKLCYESDDTHSICWNHDSENSAYNCQNFILSDDDSYYDFLENVVYDTDFCFNATQATYTREMKNQWGTLVLPFDVAAQTVKYDLYTLSVVSGTELSLKKVESTTFSAGTPVLVRMSEAAKNAETGKYVLTLTAADNLIGAAINNPDAVGGFTLTGSYDVKEITEENGYVISNNKFWNIQSIKGENKVYNAPFRAYLAGSTSNNAKMLSIGINDDATAIEAINSLFTGEGWGDVYDINGRRLNDLQQGINIVKRGGKTYKIVVK